MNNKIYFTKLATLAGTFLGSGVYNFRKHIEGVKTKRNIAYCSNPNKYEYCDVFFPDDSNSIYIKEKNRKKFYPMVVYFHGGGWASYSKILFTTLSRRLAKMGFVVFCANYSLAPKYKMNKIIEDGVCALDFARKISGSFGADKNNVVLAGDSAGAHIASEIMAQKSEKATRRNEYDYIKGLGLFYGVFDLNSVVFSGFPNIKTLVDDSIEGGLKNKKELNKYSPASKDLTKFAPCFLSSGEIDFLHESQSKTFAKLLEESGVIVKTKFYKRSEKRAMHAFMTFDGLYTNVETLKAFEKFLHKDLNLTSMEI